MKFLHSSDILLGETFAHCYPVAHEARKARLESLRSLLALARKEKVEGVIVAGNLWADNRVGASLIKEAAQLLSKSTVPIYLLPGSRDPLTPDSPYELFGELFKGKIHILRASEPLTLASGVVLLPCPVKRRQATGDPTRWIPEPEGNELRIVIAHTSDEGLHLPPEVHKLREVSYVAAGGSLCKLTTDGVHYCGTPEPTNFGQDAGFALIVELVQGAPTKVKPVKISSLSWLEETQTVSSENELRQIERRWSGAENRAGTLLQLTLRGRLDADGLAALEMARRTLAAKLLFLNFRNQIVPDETKLTFSHPLLRALVSTLCEQAAQAVREEAEDVPEEPEIAREALSQLLRVLESSSHPEIRSPYVS